MVNVNKLRGKMVECRINAESMAKLLDIDKTTFYRRIELAGENFTIREADIIVKTLKLTREEAESIFFAQFVA